MLSTHTLLARCRPPAWPLGLLCVVALASCGKAEAPGPTQVAARVNKQEISVHQLNFLLQRQQGLKPDQVDQASRQLLERLIDQQLALQKAEDLKLDRQPGVMLALDASRREIIARAYAEHVADGLAKPTEQEVREYYEARPALFAQRRLYTLAEFQVQADDAEVGALTDRVRSASTAQEIAAYLKQRKLSSRLMQQTLAPEQLPMATLDQFAQLKAGQAFVMKVPGGVRVLAVQDARPAPLSLAQVTPAIEQVLLNQRRQSAIADGLKVLRGTSQVQYMGKFADAAAAAASSAAPASAAGLPAVSPAAADIPAAAASMAIEAASGVDANAISKGLSGLK
jgi:EpsD family peptidyl-prolyl cis-trans isomerase